MRLYCNTPSILCTLTLTLTFILASCSSFYGYLENETPPFEIKKNEHKPICQIQERKGSYSLASDNNHAAAIFQETLNNIPKAIKLTTIERGILLSLIHMNLRPDISSPSARFQVFIRKNNKWDYWDVTGPSNQFPLLYGLETIGLYFGANRKLKTIAKLLDKYSPRHYPIDEAFGSFLESYQKRLGTIPKFRETYFRARQILQPGESIPKINFQKLVRNYQRLEKKNYQIRSKLFPFEWKKDPDLDISCNIDLNLYSQSIYPIRNLSNTQTNPFGIIDEYGNAFIAVSSNSYSDLSPSLGTYLISGNDISPPISFCKIQGLEKEINLFSFSGRDPGQHIYHLIEQRINNSGSFQELDELIAFPRHQFLLNPLRMLYESNRASKKQINKFLGMGIPLYHSEKLGNLWALALFKESRKKGFILDPRSKGKQICIK